MGRRSSRLHGGARQINELNMTSLMDLTFMLLIAFIITFPLVEQGIPVRLPKGKAQQLPEAGTVTVTLDKEGRSFVGEAQLEGDALVQTLKSRLEAEPKLTVLLRADGKLPYEEVTALLGRMHGAGISRIALVTDPAAAGAAAP